MPSITSELPEILSEVRRPGDFHAEGRVEIAIPGLEVEGVGPVALPLLPVQAEQLIAVAERAPYGRGEETLVDTNVRRTWQIQADRVRITGRTWSHTLADIVARAAQGLGVSDPVDAELYKLLIYDQGSFFVSHRDTEKSPGMFATLIVVLPSRYDGGELVVQHKGREALIDLRTSDPSEVAFAAFYADCVHEVRPITSGCRLTLVYNLVRQGKDLPPQPPDYEAESTRIAALLRRWIADRKASDEPDPAPEKLIYPLEHAYTPAELSFETLKGADAAAAAVLISAAERADCDLHLTLVSIEETGSAESLGYSGWRGRRRSRWDEEEEDEEEDFEVIDIFDRKQTLSEWRGTDGSRWISGEFPFEEEELCPPDAFEDREPDEKYFQEATGNEGATFERTYRRAALVLWPRERRIEVLNQGGQPITVPFMEDLTSRWEASGSDAASPLWAEAHALSGQMLFTWLPEPSYLRSAERPSDAGRMLNVLSRLKDTARIDSFLSEISATGDFGPGDEEAVLKATGLLSPERAGELIAQIVAGNRTSALGACGNLLAKAATAPHGPANLIAAALALVEALPGPPIAMMPGYPPTTPSVAPDFVADLLSALPALGKPGEDLAERALDHILAWPQTYGMDAVLVPAALRLIEQPKIRDAAAVRRLHSVCIAHLRARIAEPLEPPHDWKRPAEVICQCANCRELSHFLADPSRREWTLKAKEADRKHLEHSIRQSQCDLDFKTVRSGSPHSLVCTKNQASYERRVRRRRSDLEFAARLDGTRPNGAQE